MKLPRHTGLILLKPTLTQNSQMTFRRDQLATPPSSTP